MHIDVFTVIKGVIVITGWNNGPLPEILQDGKAVRSIYARVRREDLCGIFGEKAADWGFAGSGIAGEHVVDVSKLSIRLPDGRVVAPIDLASATARQHQQVLNQFLETVQANPGLVLEIGSRARSGNSYRSLFPESCDYIGLDITAGPNVDVVGDAHHLTRYIDRTVQYIFSISVFEHILMPWKVAVEMNAIMADGGYAYIQSHHGWPLHEEPWDFWRFSSNAWKGLFNKQTGFEVVASGYDLSAMVIPDINLGGPLQNLDHQRTHLLSACLIRKSGPALADWKGEAAEVYDLGYSHA